MAQPEPPHRRADPRKGPPTGDHPYQLYSMGTPNGQKVTILLEELLGANLGSTKIYR